VHGVDLLISVGTLPPVLDVEILMKTLVLAAAAVLIAASTAGALITSNGPQLTGMRRRPSRPNSLSSMP